MGRRCLTAAAYREFSLAYLERILAGLIRERDGERVPSIVNYQGGGLWLEAIAASGCDGVGLDWSIDLGEARRRVGDRVALQGNLDPAVLLATPKRWRARRRGCSTPTGRATPDTCSTSRARDLPKFTPPDNVAALVETVHAYRRTGA